MRRREIEEYCFKKTLDRNVSELKIKAIALLPIKKSKPEAYK
jgi:hypothetical protein